MDSFDESKLEFVLNLKASFPMWIAILSVTRPDRQGQIERPDRQGQIDRIILL